LVFLTIDFNTLYWAHKHWHETMDGGFGSYLMDLDPSKADVIIDFLTRVENFLVRRIESPE